MPGRDVELFQPRGSWAASPMSWLAWLRRRWQALRRLVHVLTRAVRAARGKGGVALRVYRGYGSKKELFLIGRVVRQPAGPASGAELADLGRLILQRGVAGARLLARFNGDEAPVTTDADGYFRLRLKLRVPPPEDRLWHRVAIELVEPEAIATTGDVFIPPADSRLVVISDIDDTVVYTGVANKVKMLWRLFMQDADDRVAFPGTAAFLNALHCGRSGREANPILYVSRGPWSIYEVLDEFFNRHAIPVGPILFLREWGLTLQSPLPRRTQDHKLSLIRDMLRLYEGLPFVLIGDSGQHDPEIYAQVVQEHPGRIRAIYIRDVTRSAARDQGIALLAGEVEAAGAALVLTGDSGEMASHAARHGLIAPLSPKDVIDERDGVAAAN